MALRNILNFDDEALRKKSREVTEFDDKLWVLLDDMYETMHEHSGVGLAAIQVGVLKRIVVVDVGNEKGLIELVNPVVKTMKGSQREVEGCLSSPGLWGYVARPERVIVEAQDRRGKKFKVEGEGLLAIAMCHEIDHLNVIIFTDKADEMVDKEEAKASRKKQRSRARR